MKTVSYEKKEILKMIKKMDCGNIIMETVN